MAKIFLIASLVGAVFQQNPEQLTLQVFYESKCPDSMNWMREQLNETWNTLGETYIAVDFYPYGKATDIAKPFGGYAFQCQHGPEECEGNKVQACLLDRISHNPTQIDLIICIMSSSDPPTATEQCMNQLGMTDPSYDDILSCQNSIEGETLLHEVGVVTHAEEPPITWVPWVKINDAYYEDDFDAIQHDLLNYLCQNYFAGIPECGPTQDKPELTFKT